MSNGCASGLVTDGEFHSTDQSVPTSDQFRYTAEFPITPMKTIIFQHNYITYTEHSWTVPTLTSTSAKTDQLMLGRGATVSGSKSHPDQTYQAEEAALLNSSFGSDGLE